MLQLIENDKIDLNTCLIISENKEFKIIHTDFDKVNFVSISPKEFTQFRPKKDRKTDSYVIPEVSTKYDLIIIDECNSIGGNTVLTSALKVLIRQSIAQKGYIAMKSYFDPVLEKDTINKKTRKIIVSNLTLQDESIILYDNYDKISSLHIYANSY